MPKLHRPVTYKKQKGSLVVTGDAVTFQGDDEDQDDNEGHEEEWQLSQISKCMANPPTAEKALLKLVLISDSSAVKPPMFTFTTRAKLDACKNEIQAVLNSEAVGVSATKSTTSSTRCSGISPKNDDAEYNVDAEQVVPVVQSAAAPSVATEEDVNKTTMPPAQQTTSATNTHLAVQSEGGNTANACAAGAMGGFAGIMAVVCCCICIYVVLPLVIWAIISAQTAATVGVAFGEYDSTYSTYSTDDEYTWVETTNSPLAAPPSPPPTPCHDDSEMYYGSWTGTVDQSNTASSYPVTVVYNNEGLTVDYPTLRCGISNPISPTAADGKLLQYTEVLDYGTSRCVQGGTGTLTLVEETLWQFKWQSRGITVTGNVQFEADCDSEYTNNVAYGNRFLFQEDVQIMHQVEQHYYNAFANEPLMDG